MRLRAVLVAAGVFLLSVPAEGAARPTIHRVPFSQLATAPASDYVPGRVLVGYRPGVNRVERMLAMRQGGLRVIRRFSGFRMHLLRVPPSVSVHEAVEALNRNPAVAWAEPDYIRHPLANPADGLFPQEWDLNNTGQLHAVSQSISGSPDDHAGTIDADIDAPEAWAVTQGSPSTVVAVIDTGVDFSHPDLSTQKWVNPGETPDGLDNGDGNTLVDDLNGWDFGENDNTLVDAAPHFSGFEHGSHVAGMIAAARDESTGVVGVCPGCRIMALKIAENNGDMPISNEVKALAYAKANGARIANMSLGGFQFSNAEREAIRKSGILVVVAAGNDSLDNDMLLGLDIGGSTAPDVFSPSYPAAYSLDNVLTVAATNDEDRYGYSTECFVEGGLTRNQCAFTDWGHDSVDVAAPGVDITSTVPGAGWETFDGTSMAAPHVAGVAGLVLSQNPLLSTAQVKNAVMHGVDKPLTLHTLNNSSLGATKTGAFTRTSGRVNALAALSASTSNATPVTDGNINHAAGWSTNKKSGSVKWPSDINDVYKRKLTNGHRYRFTLVVPTGKDYDLLVWKPGTKEIWQFDNTNRLQKYSARGNGVDEVVEFSPKKTGTYYIQVSSFFKSGSYTLKFKRVS
jgi:subtilisin family serine protease